MSKQDLKQPKKSSRKPYRPRIQRIPPEPKPHSYPFPKSSHPTVYAYLRVSTNEQDTESQKQGILKYCKQNSIKVDKWISVKGSATRYFHLKNLEITINLFKENDILIVSELTRIGRSMHQIHSFIQTLLDKKVGFISVKENIHFKPGETPSLQQKTLLGVFSLAAEIEKTLISQRTKEGMERARLQGKQIGRRKGTGKSKLDKHRVFIIKQLKDGVPKKLIALKLNTSPENLYRWLRIHDLLYIKPEIPPKVESSISSHHHLGQVEVTDA